MLMMTRTIHQKYFPVAEIYLKRKRGKRWKHPTPIVPEESGMEAYRHFGV